jgi:hypothetical protein
LSGGAAGTIAKTISAYDMRFSDALYGKEASGRYVSENRLRKMLETEYDLVIKRVSDQRPKNSIYLRQNQMIEPVQDYDESVLHIWPEEVHQKLKKGRGDWESMVPQAVADEIIKHRMFEFGSER